MSLWFSFQLCLFTVSIHIFTLFIYIVYFSDYNTLNSLEADFDILIVGSGTAGSLIAHLIASKTNYSFKVIEAGRRGHAILDIPVFGPLLHGSVYDWLYETTPQKNACLAMNKKCKLTQGKIFGGSSKINNMIYMRGNISHYVNWFNGRHSAEFIRKQFEYIENILQLGDLQFESELVDAILDASKELGYEILDNEKFNSKFGKGFIKNKLSQRNGKRWCTSDNVNLDKHVITNALVEKINFVKNVAQGVSFVSSNKRYTYNAKKAVIISAGTYNTPKILQLSGIGPGKLLKSLNIPVIQELPVGYNLQDHVTTGFDFIMFNQSLSLTPLALFNPFNILEYFLNGRGPFTSPGSEVIGFMSTKNETVPNLQLMVLPTGISSDRGSNLRKQCGISDDIWYGYFAKTFENHTATILPVVLHPKSKGYVYINSKDPNNPPSIDPKYLSHKEDVDILIEGLKLIMKFVETDAMKAIGAYINPLPFPGCENHVMFSNIYLECYVRHLTLTGYHPVATCSMGLPNSKESVVDTSFKVIGLYKLYVADGSVLPSLPSGNINGAIAMMANIFFDTVIAPKKTYVKHLKVPICIQIDFLHEWLYNICISRY